MDKLHALVIALATSLLSYFHPIYDDLVVLAIVFVANSIVGHFADIISKKEGFNFRKAWWCVVEFATFSVILACMYVIAHVKGIENTVMVCISMVSYGVLYFYTCNILRNLKLVFAEHTTAYKVVEMLYYFVSVEIIKSIPFLNNYIKNKDKENEKH